MDNKEILEEALKFATKAHKGQFRKGSNKEYIIHPIAVCEILKGVTDDIDILTASLLHDVIEDTKDTKYNYEGIKEKFGEKIADIVQEVSKDDNGDFHIKTQQGLMVKLADMLHNISDCKDEAYIQKKINFISGIKNSKEDIKK
jgi:(p)ppGpp synthase/HD superfamily hydrolase